MLLLMLQIGDEVFAVDSREVIEVIPRVQVKPIPHAPSYVPGLLNFRGGVVPVVDLGELMNGVPCSKHLSTRIIIVQFTSRTGEKQLLGLIAERVTETFNKNEKEFVTPSGIQVTEAPYLGGVAIHGRGMIQRLLIDKLLDEKLRDRLIAPEEQQPVDLFPESQETA